MAKRQNIAAQSAPPQPGWAMYLRTSSEDNQKPELSRARQRAIIESNVLANSSLPVRGEYIDVLTGKTPNRQGYQQLLKDARMGKFSHVIVERADRFGRNDTEALRAIDELNEFGVGVRFANSPDLDPMDPDDRVIVALSFTLARRESALLGIRTRGGLQAKRQSGGYISLAPDGYINVSGRTDTVKRHDLGRFDKWIQQDPERAPVIREAWDLLLEDQLSLPEIAEALHVKGHRHRSGRPFVEITSEGKRRANISSLSNIFHNWTYAGWIISQKNNIPPKTMRGNWDPIVTTEEFERGEAILERRNQHRKVRCTQEYLLAGYVYFKLPNGSLRRLTGSTSNSGRANGGTSYYRIAEPGGASFLCSEIDNKVANAIRHIQVAHDLLPIIRNNYTDELKERLGPSRPDNCARLVSLLKQINEEEARMARLLASGKISEDVWDGLWKEWQDRRQVTQRALETMEQEQGIHIDNLESALQVIAKIGKLYNGLEVSKKKVLLSQIIERVIVDNDGNVALELRTPFAYLQTLAEKIKHTGASHQCQPKKKKNGEGNSLSASSEQSSTLHQSCSTGWIRTNNRSVNSRLLCR